MPEFRYRSPYSQPPPQRNVLPKIVMSLLAIVVVVLGVFLLADRFGGNHLLSNATVPGLPGAPAASPGAGTASPTNLASAQDVAGSFVNLWNAGDYQGMYNLISATSQQQITEANFVKRYQGIDQEIGQTAIKITMGQAASNALTFPIHVVRQTATVGQLAEDNTIPIVRDSGGYRIEWTPSLIFANLGDGFVRWNPDIPQRGRILAANGQPLAALGSIDKVGVVPGQIKDEQTMLQKLSQALGMSPSQIKQFYQGGQPDWFMPIKNYSDPMDPKLVSQLAGIPGVAIQKWPDRVYPLGPAAAQITGYLSQVTAQELPTLAKQGYTSGDMIGRAGLEAWGEKYLRGKPGGQLVIVGPNGNVRSTLGQVKSQPAADIVTTIDISLQQAAYKALNNRPGSAVVVDPNSGAILAMVSGPSYDPNQFILGMTNQDWTALNNPTTTPLLNRATQSSYPIGSTFKIVTTLAAMTDLGMTPQTQINCPGSFSLPNDPKQVWKDWSITGQGLLTLHNALVQSCDTVMYQIGVKLDQKNPNLLPDMAKAFGFGKSTGLPELPETAGVVPDPAWTQANGYGYWSTGDAVNLSIGQGYFLASPLQVADAYAAVANGGTLWQPYLVKEVDALNGTKLYVHQPKQIGKLPGTPQMLQEIRSALHDVVTAPNGTAAGLSVTHPFAGETHSIGGKTGTAQSGHVLPHAWFAAFSPVEGAKLVAVGMVEHGGEGGDVAAPITRQIIDTYYTEPKP
ncbi:MAG TPA: penicillin-binding protein 2 [Thermomicrobiaceae bacterium]|nr:penicillin-binding protein 2 [Thermomicrobiaceae bacterium]